MLPIPGFLTVLLLLIAGVFLFRARLAPQRYRIAFLAMLALTMASAWAQLEPSAVMVARVRIAVVCAIVCAVPALRWIRLELKDPAPGARRPHILGACALALMFLVVGYHISGAGEVAAASQEARSDDAATLARGESIYSHTCIACHAPDRRLVGPPMTEIARLYADDPAGIARWAKAPGKRRPDYPQMPPVLLPEDDLEAVGAYMVHTGRR